VWLSMVLHHCPDPAAALEECRRVLAPDGVIALRTGTRGTVDSFEFLRFYPSALAKERTSMPAAATLSEWVSRAGLIVAERREVHQRIWSSYEDYRDRVLGHGFPSLAFCPPEELAAGDAA